MTGGGIIGAGRAGGARTATSGDVAGGGRGM
jgi:hypothetical protein